MATAIARLTGPPTPITQVRPDLSPALVSVIDQALQAEPAHRIPSAARFDEALHRAEAGVLAPPRTAATSPGLGPVPSVTSTGTMTTATVAGPTNTRPTTPRPTARPTARPAPPRRRRPGRVLLFLLFLVLLGLAAGLLTAWLVSDDTASNGGSDPSASETPADTAAIRDFDPEGDGQENPNGVLLAVDGRPDTAWQSETYETRDLGGLKPGVGLVVQLDTATAVSAVEIDGEPGADVEIYIADEPGDALADWGPARGAATDIPGFVSVTVDPTTTGRAVLVWFTRTPPNGRIEVQELRVV